MPLTPGEIREIAAVWREYVAKELAPLRAQLAELAAANARLAERSFGGCTWAGPFVSGSSYKQGSLATHAGSLWIAREDTGSRPGIDGSKWTLIVKNGAYRGEKDAR